MARCRQMERLGDSQMDWQIVKHTNKPSNRWKGTHMHKHREEQVLRDSHNFRRTDTLADRQTHWPTDRHIDRQTDRWIEGKTDRQMDRKRDRQTNFITRPLEMSHNFKQFTWNTQECKVLLHVIWSKIISPTDIWSTEWKRLFGDFLKILSFKFDPRVSMALVRVQSYKTFYPRVEQLKGASRV
jgi:hypothetical protein